MSGAAKIAPTPSDNAPSSEAVPAGCIARRHLAAVAETRVALLSVVVPAEAPADAG